MKRVLAISLFILCSRSGKCQSTYVGLEFGYQIGKEQYVDAGLNFTYQLNTIGTTISAGVEDNINAKSLGYRLGISAFPYESKLPPLSIGVNSVYYAFQNESLIAIRPELGLSIPVIYGAYGFGRISILYGYNFPITASQNGISTHLLRVSIMTNFRGVIELIGLPFR